MIVSIPLWNSSIFPYSKSSSSWNELFFWRRSELPTNTARLAVSLIWRRDPLRWVITDSRNSSGASSNHFLNSWTVSLSTINWSVDLLLEEEEEEEEELFFPDLEEEEEVDEFFFPLVVVSEACLLVLARFPALADLPFPFLPPVFSSSSIIWYYIIQMISNTSNVSTRKTERETNTFISDGRTAATKAIVVVVVIIVCIIVVGTIHLL